MTGSWRAWTLGRGLHSSVGSPVPRGGGRRRAVVGSLLLGLLLTATVGCGPKLTAIPISPRARAEMGADHGIPYYVPRPFLLVTRNIEVTDESLVNAGIVTDAEGNTVVGPLRNDRPAISGRSAGSAGKTTTGTGTGAASGGESPAAGAVASVPGAVVSSTGGAGVSALPGREEDGAEGPASAVAQLIPTYRFRVVYLPDLSRQYALQQRGSAFGSTTVKYELEGGWMFKGTEISAESRLPEVIEATTSGAASILGASLEQVFASLFPIPQPESGVSGVGGGSSLDLSPRIWLFEIQADDRGQLNINTQKPLFEWPPRADGPRRVPVEGSRDPGMGDVGGSSGMLRPTGGTPVMPTNPGAAGASGGSSTQGVRMPAPSVGGRRETPMLPSYNYFMLDGALWM